VSSPNLLITGAGGQLGRDVLECAARQGLDAIGFGSTELDVRDEQHVLEMVRRVGPNAIIHCAAYTNVDGAEADRDGAFAVNEAGSRNIALAANDVGAHLVVVSTDYVFDGTNGEGYVEGDATNPINVYGASKLAGEIAAAEAAPDVCVARTAWLFGRHGGNFVRTIAKLASERDELSVVTDQVGSPTYTEHLAAALIECAQQRISGIVHLGGEPVATWFDVASEVVAVLGAQCEVNPTTSDAFPRPAARPACSILRTSRDDTPTVGDWREGVRRVVAVAQLSA
jgi:dTDP-4-dehydrorhamnose reductase